MKKSVFLVLLAIFCSCSHKIHLEGYGDVMRCEISRQQWESLDFYRGVWYPENVFLRENGQWKYSDSVFGLDLYQIRFLPDNSLIEYHSGIYGSKTLKALWQIDFNKAILSVTYEGIIDNRYFIILGVKADSFCLQEGDCLVCYQRKMPD